VFRQSVGRQPDVDFDRRKRVQPRPLGEVQQRFFFEQFDLPAGLNDRPRSGLRTGAVGDGLFERPRQDQGVGRVEPW
jgi:hypothetical protein